MARLVVSTRSNIIVMDYKQVDWNYEYPAHSDMLLQSENSPLRQQAAVARGRARAKLQALLQQSEKHGAGAGYGPRGLNLTRQPYAYVKARRMQLTNASDPRILARVLRAAAEHTAVGERAGGARSDSRHEARVDFVNQKWNLEYGVRIFEELKRRSRAGRRSWSVVWSRPSSAVSSRGPSVDRLVVSDSETLMSDADASDGESDGAPGSRPSSATPKPRIRRSYSASHIIELIHSARAVSLHAIAEAKRKQGFAGRQLQMERTLANMEKQRHRIQQAKEARATGSASRRASAASAAPSGALGPSRPLSAVSSKISFAPDDIVRTYGKHEPVVGQQQLQEAAGATPSASSSRSGSAKRRLSFGFEQTPIDPSTPDTTLVEVKARLRRQLRHADEVQAPAFVSERVSVMQVTLLTRPLASFCSHATAFLYFMSIVYES